MAVLLFFPRILCAQDVPGTTPGTAADDARRQAAIAEYTRQMQAANYPALFEKAAREFNVPVNVLEAVSFAETRWTPLQWPPGETVSPDNGMPHAYGIMSLWDNDYFGHTLGTAAGLIGQSPDTLKTDTFQNIRGAAALLRQLYDNGPKPSDATNDGQVESWRYAVAKYTGIPQAELGARHALRVYEFMNRGYHQFGIEWPGQPVNLAPIRAEVEKLKMLSQQVSPSGSNQISTASAVPAPASNFPVALGTQSNPSAISANSIPGKPASRFMQVLLLWAAVIVIVILFRLRKRKA